MAQLVLAGLHAAGIGMPEDQDQAFQWYLVIAEQGVAEGMIEVAHAFGTPGMGAEVDYIESYKWRHLATYWYQRDDVVRITPATDFNATEVALREGRLTPAQIEEAEQRADAWKAKSWDEVRKQRMTPENRK